MALWTCGFLVLRWMVKGGYSGKMLNLAPPVHPPTRQKSVSWVRTMLTKVLMEHPGDTSPRSLNLEFNKTVGADDASESTKYWLSQLFRMELHWWLDSRLTT